MTAPPSAPHQPIAVMLYDGDCGFCRRWIEKWRRMTEPFVRYAPYQKEAVLHAQIKEDDCRKSVQLILTDGTVVSGAEAVFRALELGGHGNLAWCYEHIPGFAFFSEAAYKVVAHNRLFFSKFL